jgi:hypothetical protein
MASKTTKWMVTVASAAISVVMGGAAFAAPADPFDGTANTMRLLSEPIGEPRAAGGTAPQTSLSAAQVTSPLRPTDGSDDAIGKGLSRVVSTVGTKVVEAKGQAREVLRQVS